MKNHFDLCKATRKISADSLLNTLQKVLNTNEPVSESQFRDLWLSELKTHKELFPDGWYTPPPHGIGVLFSNDDDFKRTNYKSLRPEENWPKKNVFLNKQNGMAYFFAGPVEKKDYMIGDFGLTVYFGKNKKIIDYITTCYQITKDVFSYAEVGMKFSDITKYCTKLCSDSNLINTIESSTDPTGSNIGHTIPSTENEWTKEEKEVFTNGPWEKICKQISSRRIFLNESEQTTLTKGMAITIEPRPRNKNDPTIPMVSFHTTGLFHENGSKEWLTNFDEIFKLVRMKYMLG